MAHETEKRARPHEGLGEDGADLDRTSGDDDFHEEVAADLGGTICIHEGARTVLPQAGSDRYSAFGRHVACHPLEQMLACLNLSADGVLDRFPALKVAHLESGSGWVPFWLERMDEHSNPNISAEAKRKILWDNPARLYGLSVPPTPAETG
ncbi:MAG TPA: hypothetical protein VFC51_02885 [Chloroflexota bacterium]|nr:hypothetical protein [Chloroflexota bacterium]